MKIVSSGLAIQRTLEQALNFCELRRIVELPEVFRFLGEVFALNGRVSLVCDNVGCGVIESLYQCGQINVYQQLALPRPQAASTRVTHSSRPIWHVEIDSCSRFPVVPCPAAHRWVAASLRLASPSLCPSTSTTLAELRAGNAASIITSSDMECM